MDMTDNMGEAPARGNAYMVKGAWSASSMPAARWLAMMGPSRLGMMLCTWMMALDRPNNRFWDARREDFWYSVRMADCAHSKVGAVRVW